MTSPALSNLMHPRRMFAVYDKLPEFLSVWKANRKEEQQRGLLRVKRQPLPHGYTRSTPTPTVAVQSDAFLAFASAAIAEQQLLSHFAHFWINHRQIFDFHATLTDALRDAEIAEVPWGDLLLPHQEFYLSFPHADNPRFTVNGTEYIVDGAYVIDSSSYGDVEPVGAKVVTFMVTAHPSTVSTEELVSRDDRPRAMPFIHAILSARPDQTVGDALANCGMLMSRHAQEMDEGLSQQVRAMVPGVEFASPPVATHFRNFYAQTAPVLDQIMSLLVNAIFYLTQRPEDLDERMDPLAPPELSDVAEFAPKLDERRKASAILRDRGFTRLKFVVNRPLAEAAKKEPAAPTGRTMPVHRRRAHWHRFAHGPGRTLRKWRFVHFLIVNEDKGDLSGGAIHNVAPEPT